MPRMSTYYDVVSRQCPNCLSIFHLAHGSIDDRHHNLWFAEAYKHQAASRPGCHDPKPWVTGSRNICRSWLLPDTGLHSTALDGDIRALPTQKLPHISSHLLCTLLPGCLEEKGYGSKYGLLAYQSPCRCGLHPCFLQPPVCYP